MFEGLGAEGREGFGWTMVLDKGAGLHALEDLLAVASPYIQVIKFGWGTTRVLDPDLVREKVSRIRSRGIHVSPGGTFLEIAHAKGKVNDFLADVSELGFDTVEVSNGVVAMTVEEKLSLIRRVRDAGLMAVSEVGKKTREEDLEMGPQERAEQALQEIEAGSEKVIMEARESGSLGIFDADGSVRHDMLDRLIEPLDLSKILFEAPLKNQQVTLVKRFGPQVHLGNVAFADAVGLETLRRGLRADTVHELLP